MLNREHRSPAKTACQRSCYYKPQFMHTLFDTRTITLAVIQRAGDARTRETNLSIHTRLKLSYREPLRRRLAPLQGLEPNREFA